MRWKHVCISVTACSISLVSFTLGGTHLMRPQRGAPSSVTTGDPVVSEITKLQKRIHELEKDNARLAHELSVKMDKYGLYWLDCPEAFDSETEGKIPVLEEIAEREIRNADGKPTHILIEGDNYHALTCLNFTHRGKIDVIYIDPPYNTGEDFTYCDKRFLDKYPNGELIRKDHPLRHSAWLSFMGRGQMRCTSSMPSMRFSLSMRPFSLSTSLT